MENISGNFTSIFKDNLFFPQTTTTIAAEGDRLCTGKRIGLKRKKSKYANKNKYPEVEITKLVEVLLNLSHEEILKSRLPRQPSSRLPGFQHR